MMKDTGKDIKPGQLLPGLCSDARFLKYSVLFFDTERLQVYCNIFSGIKKSGNSLYCYSTRPIEGVYCSLRKSHSKSIRDGIFAVKLGFFAKKPRKTPRVSSRSVL